MGSIIGATLVEDREIESPVVIYKCKIRKAFIITTTTRAINVMRNSIYFLAELAQGKSSK